MRINRRKGLVIAGILLIVCSLLFVSTSTFQQWLLHRAENAASNAGFPFKAARLRLELRTLKVSLDGLSYDQDGQRIQVGHLEIDFPWDALRNGLRITSVEADRVSVDIRSSEPSVATVRHGRAPRIQIDHVVIRNAALSYSTPTIFLKIPSLSLEATDGQGVIRLNAGATVGPQLSVNVEQIPFRLVQDSGHVGPAKWTIDRAKQHASGSAQVEIRWSPAIALETDIATDPITIDNWKDIRVNGKASYSDGVISVSEFRAMQGGGEAEGSVRISDAGNSASINWNNVNLKPSGVDAHSSGTLNLKWRASDWSDVSAEGNVRMNSRQYGEAQTNIQIAETKATFDIRAQSKDLAIQARVTSRLDKVFAGSFKELQATLSGTIQPLGTAASPVLQRIGAVRIAANGVLRNDVLTLSDIHAISKSNGSKVSGASFQVNLTNERIRSSIPHVRIDLRDFAPDVAGTASLSAGIDGTLHSPTASVTGYSAAIDVGIAHIDEIRLEGNLANGSGGTPEIHGTLSGTVHPRAGNGKLEASGTSYHGFESINVSASATLRDNILNVDGIHAESDASSLSDATLQVNLNDRHLYGSISQIRVNLAAITPDVVGTANLAAGIGGTIDQPVGSFTGFSSGMDIRSTHIDGMDVEGTFAKDSLTVTRLQAHQGDGVLQANGNVNLATEQVQAQVEASNVKILSVPDLIATVFAKGTIGGTYRSPNISFSGELRDVAYNHEEQGTIRVEGETDLKTATVRANSEKYTAHIDGEVTLEAPYVFAAGLQSTKSHIHYGKYDATTDGAVRVSGQAQPFKAEHVEFDKFVLRSPGIELSADGSMDTGTALDVQLDLAKLPIEGVELSGTARALATLSGELKNPCVEGAVTTDGVTVRAKDMQEAADVTAQVDFTGHDFSVRALRASLAGATATITGSGSWRGESQLQFRVENLRPENFVSERPITGIAGIDGELHIKSPRLEDVSGRARVTELDIAVRDAALHQSQPIEVEFENQRLTVRNFETEGFDTHMKVTGFADLTRRSLNFDVDADTDISILDAFMPNAHPAGRVRTRVALRGTMDKPDLDGFINISGGEIAIEQPDILLSEIAAEAQLRDNRIEITRASGLVNGGIFEASGGTGIAAAGLQAAALRLRIERGQLEYPEGLQSEFSSQLSIDGSTPNLTLTGSIDVLNAIYDKDLSVTQQIFARLKSPVRRSDTRTSTAGDQIRMEIEVLTPGPVIVKNNVADLEATGSFRILGTAANPIILGRAVIQDGGELFFGPAIDEQSVKKAQRSDRYTIERGSIDFNNPLKVEPTLDFLATHELDVKDEHYLVRLEVTGTPETLRAELTSDPHLEQSDIVTMLLTGRTLQDLQGTYASVAGEQALSYVSGQLSERVLSQAGNALGLSTVRIDPVTVAGETDLAARLTIAKDITRSSSLVYSQYLNEAKSQTWIASYKPLSNFTVRGINDTEQNEAIIDVKQDLRFGGGAKLPKHSDTTNEPRLRDITFTGTRFAEKKLRKQVAEKGSPYGPTRAGQDARNLRRYFASEGFPAARIQTQQSAEGREVDVRFDIVEGPKIVFDYEGAEVPGKLRNEIQQSIRSSEAASLRDGKNRLLRYFRSDGYLQVQVSSVNKSSGPNDRRYVFHIDPGTRFDAPALVFNGVESTDTADIAIDISKDAGSVMEKPEAVQEQIESQLRGNGYLDATSTVPRLIIEGSNAHFEATVLRGQQYTIGSIEFEGNSEFDDARLHGVLDISSEKSGENSPPFTSKWLDAARQKIISEYWHQGFNDVQVVPSTNSESKQARADIHFAISEGAQQIFEAIEISGVVRTSRAYINRQFQFKKGDPVDHTKVNLTRKKLYDTRAFTRVEIEVVPGTTGYIARVKVFEIPPWQFSYGVAVIDHLQTGEWGLGFTADLAYHNLFGRGISVGASGKLNTDVRDARAFGSMPELYGKSVTTSLIAYRTQDFTDPEELVDDWGGTIQQQWKLRDRYLLSYDYNYRKVRTELKNGALRSTDEDRPRVPLARFDISISRDSRDDMLNATRGKFVSNSFEFAPRGIGSSIQFLRNYSQYFQYRQVKGLVLASGIRVGFVWAYRGQELDPTLQFKSGGGSTVRAFKQDELTPEPGNSVLILNQEVRFPLAWIFKGVAFFDAGQTAAESKDFFHLRYGPGVGIRVQTPFILLRTDLGFNVNPRYGESHARWSFGIGQAF